MLKHKSFAYFIILKREFSSGYMRKKPSNPTKLKYFNHLLQEGLISATPNGYRLKNLRGSIKIIYGYQFRILDHSKNLTEMTQHIIDSLVRNKLHQQYHSAKAHLVAVKGRVVKGRGSNSMETHFLSGRATAMTSCRSIGDLFGISHVTANISLNRLVKLGYVKFNIVKNKISKLEYQTKQILFQCERYLTRCYRVRFESCI